MSTLTAPETIQDDDEYETEEFLVYLDLDTISLDDQLSKMKKDIKFLGLDTEAPIIQFNNQLYKGTYEYAMGTYCFFNESNRPGGIEDACFQEKPAKLHEYFGKTDKVLKMRRIFVEEKETDDNNAKLAEGEVENLDHLKVKKSYEDALNQFLKPGEKPPRDIIEIPQNTTESASGNSIVLERQQSNKQLNANGQTLEKEMCKLAMEHSKSKEVETETDIEADECDEDIDIDPDFDPNDLIDNL